MKMKRVAILLAAMLMISVSAQAERKMIQTSIDLCFGDETYTSKVEVSWDEEKPEDSDSDESYGYGDTGPVVMWIQESLKTLEYYMGDITGNFGKLTEEAVRQFQSDNGLSPNGVADCKTMDKIKEALNETDGGSSGNPSYNSVIYNVDWFAYKTSIISGTGTYKLTDIATGKSFNIKIQSSGNHADVEPATAADTKVLCSLYGVTDATQLESQNKYQRRAVVMTNGNGEQFIGSIYAIPHGMNTVTGNDFDGQFCVHFLNSKTHGTDRVDTDVDGHQDKIAAGAAALTAAGYTVQTVYPKSVYNVDWFDAMKANNVITKDETLILQDIEMSVSFQVKVQTVGNHADVEPLRTSDTEVLCSLYGVANAVELETYNKYQRRAVLVTNSKGEQFIGSIYAIPHGVNTITGNNFDGLFCVHFLNSKTHGTDHVDTETGGHQDKIAAGAAALTSVGCTIKTTYP